jgi:hypothetical protein
MVLPKHPQPGTILATRLRWFQANGQIHCLFVGGVKRLGFFHPGERCFEVSFANIVDSNVECSLG